MAMQRRSFLGAIPWVATAAARAAPPSALAALRAGGVVVLMRHAQTVAGVGDPPGFRLGDCATQRNLSDAGRAQARAVGAWFKREGLAASVVRSSAWCRCIDTATLAFGRAQTWPALNSFFDDRTGEPAQTQELVRALEQVNPGRFEAWVTHMVNIAALTGETLASGEALVVAAAAGRLRSLGRLQLPGGPT